MNTTKNKKQKTKEEIIRIKKELSSNFFMILVGFQSGRTKGAPRAHWGLTGTHLTALEINLNKRTN